MVKYQATFDYSMLYSGVKSLRIDVPKDVAARCATTRRGIREKIIDPQPADVAKGCVAWSFAGETEFAAAALELRLGKADREAQRGPRAPNGRAQPAAPRRRSRLGPAWCWPRPKCWTSRSRREPPGLRPIDPQHDLPREVPGAARACEFHGRLEAADRRDALRVGGGQAHEHRPGAGADGRHARPTRSAVQALYRVQSVRQRLPLVLPPGATFDADPLRINDQSVALERGKEGQYTCRCWPPTPTSRSSWSCVTRCPATAGSWICRSFPGPTRRADETAVQQVYLAVFLPQTRTLLGSPARGAKSSAGGATGLMWQPDGNRDDKQLWRETRAGTEANQQAADTFPTDGTLYLFSTLRPADRPDGSLHLVTADRRQLKSWCSCWWRSAA